MSKLIEYFSAAVEKRASDIFIIAGGPVSYRIDGVLVRADEDKVTAALSESMVREIYSCAKRNTDKFERTGDDDFSFALPGLARFRVNAYRQRGSMAAVIRVVSFSIPDYKSLGIPEQIMSIAEIKHGLVLFSGTAGTGKSTTQACIIDRINSTRAEHIITLEDPIEYLHSDKKSIISQREIALDTEDYISALRACLRQAPDVIQLGEMRDFETMRTAITAAETGHLVIATLHTDGAVNTIDRIIDTFPPEQQQQIRVQLSAVLACAVSQKLLPRVTGGLVPAFEVMYASSAIRSMIRDGKTHQINNTIQTSSAEGMIAMDGYIVSLFGSGEISADTALLFAANPELMQKKLAK